VEKIRRDFINNCMGKEDFNGKIIVKQITAEEAICIAREQLEANHIGGVDEKIRSFIDAAQAEHIRVCGLYITLTPRSSPAPVRPPAPAPKPQPARAPVVLSEKEKARKLHLEQKKIVDDFRPKYEELLTRYSFQATQELSAQYLMEQGIPAERIPKILVGIDKALQQELRRRMTMSA